MEISGRKDARGKKIQNVGIDLGPDGFHEVERE
jgi:hypothetical protein